MASNIQRGTVKLDAGDWTRLKRLGGARDFQSNADLRLNRDVTNPPSRPTNAVVDSGRILEYGTSRIRRPASNYTAYRAWGTSDYPTQSSLNGTVTVSLNRLCNCAVPPASVRYTKPGLCPICVPK